MLRDEVPCAKSRASTRAVFNPDAAASKAMPSPVAPPPTMQTSHGPWARSRCIIVERFRVMVQRSSAQARVARTARFQRASASWRPVSSRVGQGAFSGPLRRNCFEVGPVPDGQAGEVGGAEGGGFGDLRANDLAPEDVALVLHEQIADGAPSTRKLGDGTPASASMASMTSTVWWAMLSSTACARWARVLPRVRPKTVPRACPFQWGVPRLQRPAR